VDWEVYDWVRPRAWFVRMSVDRGCPPATYFIIIARKLSAECLALGRHEWLWGMPEWQEWLWGMPEWQEWLWGMPEWHEWLWGLPEWLFMISSFLLTFALSLCLKNYWKIKMIFIGTGFKRDVWFKSWFLRACGILLRFPDMNVICFIARHYYSVFIYYYYLLSCCTHVTPCTLCADPGVAGHGSGCWLFWLQIFSGIAR